MRKQGQLPVAFFFMQIGPHVILSQKKALKALTKNCTYFVQFPPFSAITSCRNRSDYSSAFTFINGYTTISYSYEIVNDFSTKLCPFCLGQHKIDFHSQNNVCFAFSTNSKATAHLTSSGAFFDPFSYRLENNARFHAKNMSYYSCWRQQSGNFAHASKITPII